MKIIALLPVRNEAWVLPTFLSSVKPLCDEIIAINNGSTDSSREILQKNNVIIKDIPSPKGKPFAMSTLRQELLNLGRERGGTHFIWLDADEAFTYPFIKNGREIISKLVPGQKIILHWLALWDSINEYRDDDSVWSNNYKDFIVCDDKKSNFEYKFLSEARTNGKNENYIKLPTNEGAVLHYQFSAWEHFQMKQAWYRCSELIKNPNNAQNINITYSITLKDNDIKTKNIPREWLNTISVPNINNLSISQHYTEIINWFDDYGINFFEPLEIWHIKKLKDEFKKRMDRNPKNKNKIVKTIKTLLRNIYEKNKNCIHKIWRIISWWN